MESTIKKYTNKKGVTHDAHFNARGKYIGSVKELGLEPIQLVKTARVQEVAIAVDRIQELELENKQLREQLTNLLREIAKLYVIELPVP